MECRRPAALYLLCAALFLSTASASVAHAQAPGAPAKPSVIVPATLAPKKVVLPARGVPTAAANAIRPVPSTGVLNRPGALPQPMPGARPPVPAASPSLPTLVVKPPAELDGVRFLLGKWRCDGKQFASPMFGPEHVFKAFAEMKTAVDGAWFQFLYEEKGTKEHVGVKVHGLWGWDQAAKRLVRSAASSDGTWDNATAPGLEGDKVVWLGDFSTANGHLPFRNTFTRRSDKEWTHVMELKDPSGHWVTTSDVNCKR